MMWPTINDLGLQVVFRGGEFDLGEIVLEITDDIKLCPQRQWWPYCRLCRKFLFPPDIHRGSRKHQSALRWQQFVSVQELRDWIKPTAFRL